MSYTIFEERNHHLHILSEFLLLRQLHELFYLFGLNLRSPFQVVSYLFADVLFVPSYDLQHLDAFAGRPEDLEVLLGENLRIADFFEDPSSEFGLGQEASQDSSIVGVILVGVKLVP